MRLALVKEKKEGGADRCRNFCGGGKKGGMKPEGCVKPEGCSQTREGGHDEVKPDGSNLMCQTGCSQTRVHLKPDGSTHPMGRTRVCTASSSSP